MFDILGIATGFYTLAAAVTGKVWARSGPGARLVTRDEAPHYFWVVITIYAGLSIALITYF